MRRWSSHRSKTWKINSWTSLNRSNLLLRLMLTTISMTTAIKLITLKDCNLMKLTSCRRGAITFPCRILLHPLQGLLLSRLSVCIDDFISMRISCSTLLLKVYLLYKHRLTPRTKATVVHLSHQCTLINYRYLAARVIFSLTFLSKNSYHLLHLSLTRTAATVAEARIRVYSSILVQILRLFRCTVPTMREAPTHQAAGRSIRSCKT